MEKLEIKTGTPIEVISSLPDGKTEILLGEFLKGTKNFFFLKTILRKIRAPQEKLYSIFSIGSAPRKLFWKEVKTIFQKEKPPDISVIGWDDGEY